MNVVTISILSLLLALSSSSTDAAKKSDSQTVETSKDTANGSVWGSLSGVNLNHNETFLPDVREATVSNTIFVIGPLRARPNNCGSNTLQNMKAGGV